MLRIGLSINSADSVQSVPGAQAPANTGLPVITGTATNGQTLTASAGTWSGTEPISYAYQWRADGVNIAGATNSSFVLTSAQIGAVITVRVTATNAAGSAQATSAGTAAVEPTYYFVRPSGTTYGTGDGTSYANAWSGFPAVNQSLVVSQGARLAVCGEHRQQLTVTADNLDIVGNHPIETGWINGENVRTTGVNVNGRTGVIFRGFVSKFHTIQNVLFGADNGTGSFYNIQTYNCDFSDSGNQGIQHWGVAGSTAFHYNLTANNCLDEGISGHQDTTINVYGGQFRNNANAGINVVNGTILNLYNVWDFAGNGASGDIEIGSSTHPTVCNVYNCRINNFTQSANAQINFYNSYVARPRNTSSNDDAVGTIRFFRCFVDASGTTGTATAFADMQSGSTFAAQYSVFVGIQSGKFYLSQRSGSNIENISNCVFFGTGVGTAIFRQVGFTIRNSIFRGFAAIESGTAVTMTYRHCSFTNNTAGPTGTQVNSVNSNPLFVDEANRDFRLQAGSPMIGAAETIAGDFNTGIETANWGNSLTAPVVATKVQPASWTIGAFI